MDKVWAVTTYRRTATEAVGIHLWRERRTVGLFPDKEIACLLVEGNYGDLEESGYYQFAVVEPLPFGLYPINDAAERTWYEYINDRWTQLDTMPEVLKHEFRVGLEGHGPRDFTNWSKIG